MKAREFIAESNMHRGLAHIVKLVKNKFSNGDYVDALRCMGEYGLTYADVPKELQDFIYSRRRQIIQELLDILKNNPYAWRVYRLMRFIKLVGLDWPELDVIYDTAKAANDDERI